MEGKVVRVETADSVAVITIDRAGKANALTEEGKQRVADSIVAVGRRSDVSAIVLTGAGERSFCAGSDIAEMQAFDPAAMYRMLGAERSMYLAALSSPKPVVAAVNGYALGAGFILVMSCDYVVAADTARFGTPELTIGVAAPLEGFLLPLVVGLGHARRLFYTGQRIDAAEAQRLGLVQEVASQAECRRCAIDAAKKIASLPGTGFGVQKSMLRQLILTGHLDAVIESSRYATSLQFADKATGAALSRSLPRRR